ncbi:hypothetical protein Poly24_45670 [Rosistilla carotiformis]|uniref:AAA+ ATPase domain-containing protein n=1 Tax=Rosistilla carotiformis TaxID=2528017 RepID=A0A518JZ61_9BACT|nr:hypothetical protein [Rosistilla carotiformis]QDV70834.1 hypothetical protein Poly24_45670 [Rosistilla carotiformis]
MKTTPFGNSRFSLVMPTATPSPHDRQAAWRQPTNPFSSRCVRPAALRFRFDQTGVDLESLADKLRSQSAVGSAIIGPHGSGKSTLVAHLSGILQDDFTSIQNKTLRIGDPTRGFIRWAIRQPAGSLLIVDGLEQLDSFRLQALLLICRLRRIRCLATAHAPLPGFCELHRTAATIDLAKQLASELLSEDSRRIAAAHDFIDQIWDDLDGNLRELWFAMYDWYQAEALASR